MDGEPRTMRERMLAGEPYIGSDPEIQRDLARAQALTRELDATDPADPSAVAAVLRRLLGGFGEGSELRLPFRCDYGYQTFVGDHVFANFGLICLDVARIEIGDDVLIGPNVQLLTATHPVDPVRRREKWEGAQPIAIGSNVWLGGGAIVCPGVTIGADTVVGAGAVVTRDLPPNVVAVGNPARVTRELTP